MSTEKTEKKAKKAKADKAAPKAAKVAGTKVTKPSLYGVILGPAVTEKSTRASEQRKVVFKVHSNATKRSVKEAVEALFGVNVVKVNTINLPAKMKVFKGRFGFRAGIKKAIVTLQEGQSIDLASGVK